MTHRKLEGCVEVRAGQTHMIVVPQWAGRLSVLDFGAGNVLYTDPTVVEKPLAAAAPWAQWDGNGTDLVRTDEKNQWKSLWLHPYPKVSMLQRGVEVGSSPNSEINLSVTKRYELSGDGKQLTYSYTLVPAGKVQQGWTIWERAVVPANSYAVIPLGKGGPSPDGYIIRDKATIEPADRMEVRGGFMVVRGGTKKGVGLAIRQREGWIAVVQGRNVLLFTYPINEAGKYPHFSGANSVFWLAPDKIEVEPMSEEATFESGKSVTFTQKWTWIALPADVKETDPVAVGNWAALQAKK